MQIRYFISDKLFAQIINYSAGPSLLSCLSGEFSFLLINQLLGHPPFTKNKFIFTGSVLRDLMILSGSLGNCRVRGLLGKRRVRGSLGKRRVRGSLEKRRV